jgi:integrase
LTKPTAWIADYFDQNRKRHIETFATQKAAKAWLVETQGEVRRGVHTPNAASVTVAEAAELWLARARTEELERCTQRSYAGLVRHITGSLGNLKLAQLSTPFLEEWRDELVEKLKRPLARRVLFALKSILKEAQRRGLVAHNAALPVQVNGKKRDRKKLEIGHGIPRKEEIQKLLSASHGWFRVFLVTATFTGMRSSELRGLVWDAVDSTGKTVTVRQRADEWGTLGLPKTHSGQRTVPLSPLVLNTLKEWKLACPPSGLGLVFPNAAGHVRELQNIGNRFWRPLQREVGLVDANGEPLFDLHALRHFCASLWIEQGFALKWVQAKLGHASIQMTADIYGHLFPNGEDEQAKLARAEIGVVA